MEMKLKEIWQDGHHKMLFVDEDTGVVLSDAYESYHISHAEHEIRKECRADLLNALSGLFGKVLTNKDCNMKARFSKNTANKLTSDKAITKSVVNGFLPQEHFEAAENIKGIFESAEYITLKEVKSEGSRIYTQELLLNEYPPHKAGELSSRGFKRSESTAYKCSPRTAYNIVQD